MSPISPRFTTVDGLRVRYADSGGTGPDALLLSPWPESVYAFERVWEQLSGHARLVALDLPGYGGSQGAGELRSPEAMGGFVLRAVEALGLRRPHAVGPDIGTSALLFAAARDPRAFRSVVVGSGGAAVPVNVTGILKEWVEEPDPDRYREVDPAVIVDTALGTIKGYTAPAHVREDYIASYRDGRFAESLAYVQQYPAQLPRLAGLLPGITTPVRVVAGENDAVVPQENALFLAERIPGSRADFVRGAGHFCWEEQPAAYAALIADWWDTH
ncbi:alpha/beta fold hydrolase [Actinacidiphila guanduensis]|uniref:Pimeloyl-ACP methyl ester carboxylesterase n=1 Tax=Actinacidiphila guanduensis TaxID=310781 RepID=A0A1H0Q313_9ACTN|nr:alpha/beta hydrolase [Actinacidiphila guanduensis]SDP11096.1 Pimeloyl-ACP methyl ester carboxylesterase [Actinacidiphila guanduensis]